MPTADDGTLELGEGEQMAAEHSINAMEMLMTHAMHGHQITADGRSALAEFTRLHHLRAADLISFKEAAGVRHTTEAGQTSTQSNARAAG